jgi:hypothetical protein
MTRRIGPSAAPPGVAQKFDAETVMRAHRATGLGPLQAREHLSTLSDHHLRQFLTAIEQHRGPTYHDPIVNDPAVAPLLAQVRLEAESLVAAEGGRRIGRCHRIWHIMQRTMRERHGIEWLTLAQMNPGMVFD